MKVQVVVQKSLVFAGLVGALVSIVALVVFVTHDLFARVITIPRWLSNVLAAAVIAAVYEPIRSWLIDVTDPYLHQKQRECYKKGE